MKKILSRMLAAATLIASLAMPATAAIDVPANVTPAELSQTIGEAVTITHDSTAVTGTRQSFHAPDGAYYSKFKDGTTGLALDAYIKIYVNAPIAGKYEIQYTGSYTFWDRNLAILVNGTEQVAGFKIVGGCHSISAPVPGPAKEITLDEGVNYIQASTDGGASRQQAFSQVSLKLLDPAPTIGTISQSELRPCVGDTFTLSAVVTDNAAGVGVTYKVGEGTEVQMTAGANNTFTADLSLSEIGDNTITVKATDATGFVTTKTHTITTVDYKSSAMDVVAAPSTADPTNKTTYTGSLIFSNSSGGDKQTCLLIAVFDSSNKLVGLNKVDTLVGAGGNPLITVSVDVPNGTYTAELMLWDDIWGMNDMLATPYAMP